jgi:hypothetical protein
MTDEQNKQSSVSEEMPMDEAMKEDADFIESKLEEMAFMMPGALPKMMKTKQTYEGADYKNQKLLEQKIQKFKQQHTMQQIAPDKALSISQNESADEDFMKFKIEELI